MGRLGKFSSLFSFTVSFLYTCLFFLSIFILPDFSSAHDLKLFPELSNRYCKQSADGTPYLRLATQIASQPLIIKLAPGQKIYPLDPETPSIFQNNFTHVIALKNISGRELPGAIAFDTIYAGHGKFTTNNAVIFTPEFPLGISRNDYVTSLNADLRQTAEETLDNFLRLFSIFTAAIDSCRPLLVVTYATSEETERIENGRRNYYQMARLFNSDKIKPILPKRDGINGGFYDPKFRLETPYDVTLNFDHLNPLKFFKAGTPEAHGDLSAEDCDKIIAGAKRRDDAPAETIRLAEFLFRETHGRCQNTLRAFGFL